jgi:hypothetical protein
VRYRHRCDYTEQCQHLSSLTALQELAISCGADPDDPIPASISAAFIEQLLQLSQLTTLRFPHTMGSTSSNSSSSSSTRSWASLTALESLTLSGCTVEPAALKDFTKLRALSLSCVEPVQEVLLAVSQLSLLTALSWWTTSIHARTEDIHVDPSTVTALTASTHLCSPFSWHVLGAESCLVQARHCVPTAAQHIAGMDDCRGRSTCHAAAAAAAAVQELPCCPKPDPGSVISPLTHSLPASPGEQESSCQP